MAANGLGQLEIFSLFELVAVAIHAQMVGLVKNDQIPGRRGLQTLYSGRPIESINGDDQSVVLGKGVGFAIRNIALARLFHSKQHSAP